jgi:hypothetical protein
VYPGGQRDLTANLVLQVNDCRSKITPADAEFDGDVATAPFAEDHEAAFAYGDVGDLRKRHSTVTGRPHRSWSRLRARRWIDLRYLHAPHHGGPTAPKPAPLLVLAQQLSLPRCSTHLLSRQRSSSTPRMPFWRSRFHS